MLGKDLSAVMLATIPVSTPGLDTRTFPWLWRESWAGSQDIGFWSS